MSSSKHEGGRLLLASRILSSRDRSSSAAVANASFRVYYSLGAGTVPFVWETKPGTPKTTLVPATAAADYDSSPPPAISPPPSYQSRTRKTYARRAPSASRAPSRWGWMTRWLEVGRRTPPPSPSTDEVELQRRPRRRAPILLCSSCASDQPDYRHG